MPIDPVTGAIITGAIASGTNFVNQQNQNRRLIEGQTNANNQNLALMYGQQAYNTRMWERQTEYNSPLNQMKRFKEAGLNPNLIYGQGTPGNADPVRPYSTPELKSIQSGTQAPYFNDISPTMMQGAAIAQQRPLLAAQTANQLADAKKKGVDTSIQEKTLDSQVKSAFNNAEIGSETLKQQKVASDIAEATKAMRVDQVRQQLSLTTQQAIQAINKNSLFEFERSITQFQSTLASQGLTPTDNVIARMLLTDPKFAALLQKSKIAIGTFLEDVSTKGLSSIIKLF